MKKFKIIDLKSFILTIIGIIGSLSSAVSLILYILEKNGKLNISGFILIILYGLVILSIVVWCFYLYRINWILRKENNIFNEVFEHLHQISHQIRDTLDSENWDDFEKSIIICFNYICNITKKIFDKLTNTNTSVCIKIIVEAKEGNDEGKIKTIARDDESKTKRDKYSNKNTMNTIENNTDFKKIYTEDSQCFIGDDLIEMKNRDEYRNETPDFEKYYISTIVVPIRIKNTNENGHTVIGFLAVDSMIVNTFRPDNKNEFISILGVIADSLFSIMIRWKKIEKKID